MELWLSITVAASATARLKSRPRSQTQIAIAADPEYASARYWTLVNASPDLRSQIVAAPELGPFSQYPGLPARSSMFICKVADVDSLIGLLHLREFSGLSKVFL